MKEFDNDLDKKFQFDFSQPTKSEVNINRLKSFLEKDPNPTLIFYGGEPLLEIERIKEIIDECKDISNIKFRIQTNGKLLDKLPIEYLNQIGKMLVSIDGDQETTDYNRGKDTYQKVVKNLQKAKQQDYKEEIIARMTLSASDKFPDIFKQVKFLIEECPVKFQSIHWQIDAGFYKFDFDEEKIKGFFQAYNNSISKLIDYWIEELQKGNLLKIYPFLGIVNRLLGIDNETCIQCGAGQKGYAITTDGKIVACPIMNSIKDFEAGNLNSKPEELKKFEIKECQNCDVRKICGGRCLYWRKSNLWPKEGDEIICTSIKHLISELKNQLPKIQEAIDKNIISKKDLEYEKYFGPEIIP